MSETPNKIRRGVNNSTKATAQLKFHEKDAAQNHLFVGHLEEVLVDFRTIGDDSKGLVSFAGKSIPRLVFHFTSNQINADERRHVYQTLLPVESNIDTIPGGSKDWQVDNVINWIKHFLDVFVFKGRAMTEAEEEALTIPFCDFDESGEYVAIDPDEVLAGYRVFFENAAAMLNGTWGDEPTNKPYYKESTGKGISLWIKLLRFIKRNNEWRAVDGRNGELAFNTFLGEGAIEILKPNVLPSRLRVDVTKESITPKEVKKAPTLGTMPGTVMAPGISPMGGFDSQPFDNSAFEAAATEMPF